MNNRGHFGPRGGRGFGSPGGINNFGRGNAFVQPPIPPHVHQQWSVTDIRQQRPQYKFGPGITGPDNLGNQDRRQQPNLIWSDPKFFQPRPFGPPGCYQFGPPRMTAPFAGSSGGDRGGYNRGGFGRGRGRGNVHNSQQNHQQNTQNRKKKKIDKRDLPENNKFHCEVCDRGFKNETEYDNHIAQHEQCSVTGCRYVAVPKLLQLHYQTQHRTGVANKIWSLDSPEDIEKWKQERKRNFPTKDNILKKKQLAAEKKERGEVIETKQFGKFRNQGRGRGRGHHKGRGWQDRHTLSHHVTNHTEPREVAISTEIAKPESMSGAGQKRRLSADLQDEGISSSTSPTSSKKRQVSSVDTSERADGVDRDPLSLLIVGKSDNETDDSDLPSENEITVRPEQMGQSSLANLMASYQSDEEGDAKDGASAFGAKKKGCEAQHEANLEREKKANGKLKRGGDLTAAAKESDVVKDSFGEKTETAPCTIQPTASHAATSLQPHSRSRHTQSGNKNKHLNRQKRPHRKPTLLEKLLKNDIRHERNVILQCVHFMVKNRFLGVCQ